ncbi:DUF3823 domain-containing protein [Arachidicoccus ginsenosidivorans]|jgi:hypothetical protein|nr:DUF3823 domain-containing protein [Arachidicoccus ginsenosidivorans]
MKQNKLDIIADTKPITRCSKNLPSQTIMGLLFSLFLFVLFSCQLSKVDNFEGPNATISGGIYDNQTGELVEQDIINGMQIEYVEHGYDNPETQYMVVKNNGTYRNDLMFANTYTMHPVRGNFVPTDIQEVVVKGNTELNFKVQPYIRIKNPKIVQSGSKIIATFNLEATVENKIAKIGLFEDPDINVGSTLNKINNIKELPTSADLSQAYSLEIDIASYPDLLIPGKEYYFRIGALIDAPEAKYNYASAILIKIIN